MLERQYFSSWLKEELGGTPKIVHLMGTIITQNQFILLCVLFINSKLINSLNSITNNLLQTTFLFFWAYFLIFKVYCDLLICLSSKTKMWKLTEKKRNEGKEQRIQTKSWKSPDLWCRWHMTWIRNTLHENPIWLFLYNTCLRESNDGDGPHTDIFILIYITISYLNFHLISFRSSILVQRCKLGGNHNRVKHFLFFERCTPKRKII